MDDHDLLGRDDPVVGGRHDQPGLARARVDERARSTPRADRPAVDLAFWTRTAYAAAGAAP